jgi:hypothetical protein
LLVAVRVVMQSDFQRVLAVVVLVAIAHRPQLLLR